MPKARILRREISWRSDEEVLQNSTDIFYPEPNGRHRRGFCGVKLTRAGIIEHFPGCKLEFLGED